MVVPNARERTAAPMIIPTSLNPPRPPAAALPPSPCTLPPSRSPPSCADIMASPSDTAVPRYRDFEVVASAPPSESSFTLASLPACTPSSVETIFCSMPSGGTSSENAIRSCPFFFMRRRLRLLDRALQAAALRKDQALTIHQRLREDCFHVLTLVGSCGR